MSDEDFMALALEQARTAACLGEVPVGAIVVWQGRVIATGRNAPLTTHDPTAHAEIVALRSAAQLLGNYRLDECELFVTLEPCAMCSGAMLHARLRRVVFGAPEPRTGAAGSVVNLFAQPQLNHHTRLQGGVLAAAGSALLQDFFRQRRADQRRLSNQACLLRDDALRTPDAAFEGLSGYPWMPHYCSDLPALAGLRLHYLDELPAPADQGKNPDAATCLCLHGNRDWSYQFRKVIPCLVQAGHRVVAPDLIGFGKSDKPKKEAFHSLSRHVGILTELVEKLELQNIILVLPEGDRGLGLNLSLQAPGRYQGRLLIDADGVLQPGGTAQSGSSLLVPRPMASSPAMPRPFPSGNAGSSQSAAELTAAYDAPFPGKGFRAGVRALAAAGFGNNC